MAQVTVKSVLQNKMTSITEGSIIKLESPTGEKMLAKVETIKKTKEEIIFEKWAALIGRPITVTEAAKKYKIPKTTIFEWTKKPNHIRILKSGYRMEIDAADMAYLADLYQRRRASGKGFGLPLVDDNGQPYEMKHPKLSEYRKRKNN